MSDFYYQRMQWIAKNEMVPFFRFLVFLCLVTLLIDTWVVLFAPWRFGWATVASAVCALAGAYGPLSQLRWVRRNKARFESGAE
jgi:hypothetical protein